MKRIFKNKFIACIIAAVVALFAAGFAVFYIDKNDNTVKAQAATGDDIFWSFSGSTLTISGSTFTGAKSFNSANGAPWGSYRDNIVTVNITSKIYPKSTEQWFYQCKNLVTIYNFGNLDVSNVENMSIMFGWCTSLSSVDVSKWNTSNVTNMVGIFYDCAQITTLNVSEWDTSKVTTFNGLFHGCSGVSEIDVSKWDTRSVTDIGYMFHGCSGVTELDVSNFDVSHVNNMSNIFNNCSGLTELDVSKWKAKPKHMDNIFNGCSSLTSLDLSNFDCSVLTGTTTTTGTSNMLAGTDALNKIKLSDSLAKKISANEDSGLLNGRNLYHAEDGTKPTTADSQLKKGGYFKTPHVHAYVETDRQDATCGDDGIISLKCSEKFCEYQTTDTIPATEHSYGAWVEKTPATCTTDRKEEHTCSKCANKEEQTVAGTKLGHLYGDPVWEWAADYSSATAKFTCTRSGCGYIHSLPGTVSTSTTAATCMAEGKTTYTATIAVTGAEFPQSTYTDPQEVPITQLNHIVATTWSKDTTEHWHECTLGCGTKLDEAAHEYTIWKVDTAATVTSAGVGHHECVCGARGADEEIPMETCSHTNKSHVAAVEATCIVAGNPEYWTCGDCGKNLDGTNAEISTIVTPVDPDNHSYTNYVSNNDADCTTDGTKTAHCDYGCGTDDTVTDVGSALGHTPGEEATCTEPQTCEVCGTELNPALDHNWATEWSKDETNHWHICTVCGEKKDEAAHTYEWIITKEPTEEETGEKEERCTVCEYANGNVETIAKLVVDDNGNVSDLPPDNDYDLEIAVKESESKYNVAGVNKGYVVELYIVNGEDRTPYGADKSVILKLVIPEGMDEFTLYRMSGDRLTEVAADEYKVEGGMLSIRTTLPDEFVFNAPVTETEEPAAGIPWWVWLIVGLVAVAIVGVVIIIIVVIKKKNNGDGGTTVVQGTNYDDAELKAKLSAQDKKLDEIKEIVDGGFNDIVDGE